VVFPELLPTGPRSALLKTLFFADLQEESQLPFHTFQATKMYLSQQMTKLFIHAIFNKIEISAAFSTKRALSNLFVPITKNLLIFKATNLYLKQQK